MFFHGVILPRKNNMVPVALVNTNDTKTIILSIDCIFPTFRAFKRYMIKNGYYGKIGFNDCWQNEILQMLYTNQ